MAKIKFIFIGIAVFILLAQGVSGGLFLNMLMPGWEGMLGHVFCIAGGYIVQPVWDFGWAKIPIPVTDDYAAGLLIASLFSWAFIRRTAWSFRRKLAVFTLFFVAGMALYKGIGLLILYWAEVNYGMSNCIGEFAVGPVMIEWAWFSPLFYVMILFGLLAAVSAVLAFKKRGGGGGQ